MKPKPRNLRRLVLSTAALAALAAPAISSGCGGGFSSISRIDGLRVIAVVADKPYAKPGDDVTFAMTYYDGFVDPDDPTSSRPPPQIVWLGGCYDPPGDAYYGCYESLAPVLQAFQSGQKPPPGTFEIGPTFTTTLPKDIISRRPRPASGTPYGIAYAFFAVCAGTLGPAPADSNGRAGSFPIACFDGDKRLGAESFVPGYTQIYAFEDGRTNPLPPVKGVTLAGKPLPEGPENAPTVKKCAIDQETRDAPPQCGKDDPFTACEAVTIDVDVDASIADVDPDGVGPDGVTKLHEVVWVDYFAEKGDFDSELRLVSDATTGLTPEHSTKWIAPPEPGLVALWIVVRDARGGATVLPRYVRVE